MEALYLLTNTVCFAVFLNVFYFSAETVCLPLHSKVSIFPSQCTLIIAVLKSLSDNPNIWVFSWLESTDCLLLWELVGCALLCIVPWTFSVLSYETLDTGKSLWNFFFFLVVCKIGSVQAACSLSPSTGSDSNISFTFKDCLCGLALPDVKVSLGLGQWFTRCQYSKGFLTLLRVFST